MGGAEVEKESTASQMGGGGHYPLEILRCSEVEFGSI